VTGQALFTVEPWQLREPRLDVAELARTESVFALSNGHIGLRGNLDEGEPHGLPGTYLNGVYELRPLPYAEAGYGYPESGQSVIDVTNGKILRLLVDDEPFDIRYGELHSHERTLSFRTGVLDRTVDWSSPAGQRIRVTTQRLVSFTQRSIVGICFDVEAIGGPARVVVQSELVANEELPAPSNDPRVAAALRDPLQLRYREAGGVRATLLHQTRRSGLRVAAAMDHLIDSPSGITTSAESEDDWARVDITTVLQPGETLRIVKFVAYGWSQQRSLPALRDQVAAALTAARHTGWDGLLAEQREYLDDFWDRADVQLDGDPELQQAVRFALFHVLQSGARAERRSIPAKGLTGPGYDGHCFWDTEMFVLPVLTHTLPAAAADVLRWRHTTLPLAVDRARQLRLTGAAFPWRTINGEECSAYWPAGTAGFHINADVADAVLRYLDATGDRAFEADVGLELLVETARLWRSLGHHDLGGHFRIDGVTGPDEYSALADNNVYTNVMAQRNLRGAAEAAARDPHRAATLGVDTEEVAAWRHAADAMVIPYDDMLRVHPQSEGFTLHEVWDFAHTGPDEYPLLLHFPYFDLYRKQVVKQADLVLALQMWGDGTDPEQKRRDFEYYERITVRDSSLSACTQSVVAAEVGHMDLAYDYAAEAALLDLHDLARNTGNGLHIASLAGAWIALVMGMGGMRDHGTLSFCPRLPEGIDRLSFGIVRRAARLRVEIRPTESTYTLAAGSEPLTLSHHGEEVTLGAGAAKTLPIPPAPRLPRPVQPPGREPARRRG
jgi:alpha,alpha-trehalose phosphorylase